ncbi:MAG: MFS transporter [Oscillospiraceae bacterium]|nr:MFS transporter [Oscillospiraceae bacterium]
MAEEKKRFGGFVDRLLSKTKISDGSRAEVQELIYHPITWLKGEALPFEKMAPWELLMFFLQGFLQFASGNWDGRDRLYRFTYKVNANLITVSDVIANIWDGLNDPLFGSWMDRNPMKDNTYRWITRVSSTVGTCLSFFYLLDLGLQPVQRIVIFTVGRVLMDILGTMSQVSGTKIYAGFTASSDERGKYKIWWEVGKTIAQPIGNVPAIIMGFVTDRSLWTDYRVYTRGFAVAMPFMIIASILPTFVRNRVKFSEQAQLALKEMEGGTRESEPAQAQQHKLTLRENFSILKHNKYMLYATAAGLVTQLTPSMNLYPLWRHLFPSRKVPILGETRGEGVRFIMDQIAGAPVTFCFPFLGVITRKLGGPKRVHIFKTGLEVLMNAVKLIVGYKSVPAMIIMTLADAILFPLAATEGYAGHVLHYEMLDYVEYKTGVRSEGVTMAFQGLVDKLLKNSLNSLTGNAFEAWTGINKIDINAENAADLIPERYSKWAWVMAHVAGIIDGLIWLWARAAFPYDPGQKDIVEADLKERRRLAQAKQEEAEAGV